MKQCNFAGEFFHAIFNKYSLAKSGLFFCVSTLVLMLILRGRTLPLDFATIYICQILAFVFQICFYRIAAQQKCQNIILPFVVLMVAISCEILIIICGVNNPSLQYAQFIHFVIKSVGIIAAIICFFCLVVEKNSAGQKIFNVSFTILASSVCMFSMMHDGSFTTSDRFWWGKYVLLEGGVIVVGILGNMHSLIWQKRDNV